MVFGIAPLNYAMQRQLTNNQLFSLYMVKDHTKDPRLLSLARQNAELLKNPKSIFLESLTEQADKLKRQFKGFSTMQEAISAERAKSSFLIHNDLDVSLCELVGKQWKLLDEISRAREYMQKITEMSVDEVAVRFNSIDEKRKNGLCRELLRNLF